MYGDVLLLLGSLNEGGDADNVSIETSIPRHAFGNAGPGIEGVRKDITTRPLRAGRKTPFAFFGAG